MTLSQKFPAFTKEKRWKHEKVEKFYKLAQNVKIRINHCADHSVIQVKEDKKIPQVANCLV